MAPFDFINVHFHKIFLHLVTLFFVDFMIDFPFILIRNHPFCKIQVEELKELAEHDEEHTSEPSHTHLLNDENTFQLKIRL